MTYETYVCSRCDCPLHGSVDINCDDCHRKFCRQCRVTKKVAFKRATITGLRDCVAKRVRCLDCAAKRMCGKEVRR